MALKLKPTEQKFQAENKSGQFTLNYSYTMVDGKLNSQIIGVAGILQADKTEISIGNGTLIRLQTTDGKSFFGNFKINIDDDIASVIDEMRKDISQIVADLNK